MLYAHEQSHQTVQTTGVNCTSMPVRVLLHYTAEAMLYKALSHCHTNASSNDRLPYCAVHQRRRTITHGPMHMYKHAAAQCGYQLCTACGDHLCTTCMPCVFASQGKIRAAFTNKFAAERAILTDRQGQTPGPSYTSPSAPPTPHANIAHTRAALSLLYRPVKCGPIARDN
jgi:hypothetical protein